MKLILEFPDTDIARQSSSMANALSILSDMVRFDTESDDTLMDGSRAIKDDEGEVLAYYTFTDEDET